jgi:hypothetical protein
LPWANRKASRRRGRFYGVARKGASAWGDGDRVGEGRRFVGGWRMAGESLVRAFVACPRFGDSGPGGVAAVRGGRRREDRKFWWFCTGAPDNWRICVARVCAVWLLCTVVNYEVFLGVPAQMKEPTVFVWPCLLEPRLAVVFYGCRSMSLPFARCFSAHRRAIIS